MNYSRTAVVVVLAVVKESLTLSQITLQIYTLQTHTHIHTYMIRYTIELTF